MPSRADTAAEVSGDRWPCFHGNETVIAFATPFLDATLLCMVDQMGGGEGAGQRKAAAESHDGAAVAEWTAAGPTSVGIAGARAWASAPRWYATQPRTSAHWGLWSRLPTVPAEQSICSIPNGTEGCWCRQ